MNEPYSLNSFVVADPDKCIGCRLCEIACSMAHTNESRPLTVGSMKNPIQPRLHLMRRPHSCVPVQCRHCEDAPCANACQVSAIVQKDGVIYVDEEKCMGCKTCMLACPFGAMELAPVFRDGLAVEQSFPQEGDMSWGPGYGVHSKQRYVASKCDLCIGEEEPACVSVCPKGALAVIVPQQHRSRRMQEAALSLAAVGRL